MLNLCISRQRRNRQHHITIKTDEEGNPLCVGCPADDFLFKVPGEFIVGSNEKDGYTWWSKRLQAVLNYLMSFVSTTSRVSQLAIPAETENATIGKWVKGPGYDLFKAVKETTQEIANYRQKTWSFMDEDVSTFVKLLDSQGMKILEFRFMVKDPKVEIYLIIILSMQFAYTGTHDNDTVLGWYKSATEETREFCNRYQTAATKEVMARYFADIWILSAVTDCNNARFTTIRQRATRMNIPSTLGGSWRMTKEQLTESVEEFLLGITRLYDRANPTS